MVFKTVSAATRKEKVVFFERFLEPINVWVLIYCFFVLHAYVLFDEDQERERTTTPIHLLRPPSWNTRLRLRIALCLRLRWTCELPCACVFVCVARVNQPMTINQDICFRKLARCSVALCNNHRTL